MPILINMGLSLNQPTLWLEQGNIIFIPRSNLALFLRLPRMLASLALINL